MRSSTVPIRVPDADGVDSNCDGIDGDLARAVFVAQGGDDATGDGTRESPLRSLGAALRRATEQGRTQVLVTAGNFSESATLQLADGVGIRRLVEYLSVE